MITKKAYELEVGDAIICFKKYFVIDWIDPEFINEEVMALYDDNVDQSDIKPEHCKYSFFDDMILNFRAKEAQEIFFVDYDVEFEYLGKVSHNDYDKGKYERNIKPKLRYQVLLKDNRLCQNCGRGIKQGATLHIDHIIPVAKGGKTEIENLQTLCDKCNYGKGGE